MNFSNFKQKQARKLNYWYSHGIPLKDFRELWGLSFHLRHKLRHYTEGKVEAVVCFEHASLKTHCNQKEA